MRVPAWQITTVKYVTILFTLMKITGILYFFLKHFQNQDPIKGIYIQDMGLNLQQFFEPLPSSLTLFPP